MLVLSALVYLLVAVFIAQLVLTSYAFEDEGAPVFPTSDMIAKSALLGLVWPALLVARLAIRANRRFGILDRLDIDYNPEWNPAPELLTVGRKVLARYYKED